MEAMPVSGPEEAAGRWEHDEDLHAWWVSDGVLAGEYPGAKGDPAAARRKLDLLVDAGIRTFVDLTTPEDGLDDYAGIVWDVALDRRFEIKHFPRPIPDLGVIDDAGYDDIVGLILAERQWGGVYVHCWGGVGRTGTVAGCLLLFEGAANGDVLGRLAELRRGTRKAHTPSPETDAQRDVLRRRGGMIRPI
jgi:Cyclin-dependent kinase inhibitor 3 (CDKN3)